MLRTRHVPGLEVSDSSEIPSVLCLFAEVVVVAVQVFIIICRLLVKVGPAQGLLPLLRYRCQFEKNVYFLGSLGLRAEDLSSACEPDRARFRS